MWPDEILFKTHTFIYRSTDLRVTTTDHTMHPGLLRKLRQVIPFLLIGFSFGIVYALIERGLLGHLDHYPATGNSYHFIQTSLSTILQATILGFILGMLEVFVLGEWLFRLPFLLKFVVKSLIYFATTLLLITSLTALSTSVIQDVPLFDPLVGQTVTTFLSDMSFWVVMLYTGTVFSVALLITEMSHHLGDGVFRNFIFGKYQVPREEERIFMFLDMKGSTTLAEKMSHVQYFNFLNAYYADISKAVIESEGEIYQYVGDEVVITWALQDQMIYDRCITCFFGIKNSIRNHADKYMRLYGHVPAFKAGLHCGMVTTGRIGILKKELVFTGDVLNTASRIQGICNTHQVDNLISENLVKQLKKISVYQYQEVGDIQLRGKAERLKLYTV